MLSKIFGIIGPKCQLNSHQHWRLSETWISSLPNNCRVLPLRLRQSHPILAQSAQFEQNWNQQICFTNSVAASLPSADKLGHHVFSNVYCRPVRLFVNGWNKIPISSKCFTSFGTMCIPIASIYGIFTVTFTMKINQMEFARRNYSYITDV